MAKRIRSRSDVKPASGKVHPLFAEGLGQTAEVRDQSYLRKVKPRSPKPGRAAGSHRQP